MMVDHIAANKHATFTECDVPPHKPLHNDPLHLLVQIHKSTVRRVLVDGGAGLNICTLKLIKQLGYSESSIDVTQRINIRAYDEKERSSKGIIILLVCIGPVVKNTPFQILDLKLGYNMLLGRPWIH